MVLDNKATTVFLVFVISLNIFILSKISFYFSQL